MTAFAPHMTPQMIHVLSALALVVALLSYLSQTKWMARYLGDPLIYLLLYGLLAFALSNATLGGTWPVAAKASIAFTLIHATALWLVPEDHRAALPTFLLELLAHLAIASVLAIAHPGAMASGIWADLAPALIGPALLFTGAILGVWAGGRAVGLLTLPFQDQVITNSLPNAGRLIGLLERSIIFLLILVGQPAGVGFLIAAKSVLRFDTAAQGQKASEYVIIGTLASFAWALVFSYATLSLLEIAAKAP